MSNGPNHRVVFRRRRYHSEPAANGNWKIAYADFITAMMAFFLVMWLISITPAEQREALAEFFRAPLRDDPGSGRQQHQSSPIPGGGTDVTRADGEMRKVTSAGNRRVAEASDRAGLQNLKQRLEQLMAANPVLRQYRPQMLIDFTSEGLRIQIVDDRQRPMFATGSAEVATHMRIILREIAPLLNDLPNRISLSGHTDAAPYFQGERAYSNWELSADRANASRRELLAGGMHEGKVLRVMGLASTMNLVKDDPYHATNRRISLVVLNRHTQTRIEHENAAAADIHMSDVDRDSGLPADSSLLNDKRPLAPF